MAKSRNSAGKSGGAAAAAGFAARGYNVARKVNWPAVWIRAQWLAHHTKRLYENLTEAERKEFMSLVVPLKDGGTGRSRTISRDDRVRIQELVSKALFGDSKK